MRSDVSTADHLRLKMCICSVFLSLLTDVSPCPLCLAALSHSLMQLCPYGLHDDWWASCIPLSKKKNPKACDDDMPS